jgi:hypothetical protein
MPTVADGASQLPLFHILGFTGHRQIAHPEIITRAIGEALDFLKSETPGEWVVLSSVAEGGDQLFVRQALQRGISWHAILPLPHQDFARDFSQQQWQAVQALLGRAEHLQVSNDDGGPRDDAYLDCGMETSRFHLTAGVWVEPHGPQRTANHQYPLGRQGHPHHRCNHRRAARRELELAERARAGTDEPEPPARGAHLGRQSIPCAG